jgi:hypothetical protein
METKEMPGSKQAGKVKRDRKNKVKKRAARKGLSES